MTAKRKATRKTKGAPPNATPRQLYLHHIEEMSVHLRAAVVARKEMSDAGHTKMAQSDVGFLETVGGNLATLYRRAGGNPDATK